MELTARMRDGYLDGGNHVLYTILLLVVLPLLLLLLLLGCRHRIKHRRKACLEFVGPQADRKLGYLEQTIVWFFPGST